MQKQEQLTRDIADQGVKDHEDGVTLANIAGEGLYDMTPAKVEELQRTYDEALEKARHS